MTHCYLRAMSPIHIKCTFTRRSSCTHLILTADLGNMGVRASMSVVRILDLGCRDWRLKVAVQSIMAFGQLWGLVACHSYGPHGMRVSFPVRQMLRLLSQSISRNVERLSYAQRLHTRKLVRSSSSPVSVQSRFIPC